VTFGLHTNRSAYWIYDHSGKADENRVELRNLQNVKQTRVNPPELRIVRLTGAETKEQ